MSHDEHHPTDTDDDALQEVLGSALRDADPVPRHVIAPSRTATVRLEGAENALEQAVDRFGRFTFDSAPPGPVRLTVSGSDGAAVTTDWILL
jgi:hypothetical protein